MKFFSNEAKENEPGYDRSDVATSEPVAVPQQRAGSPWSDAPGDSDYRDPEQRDSSDGEHAEPEAEHLSDPITTTYGPDGTVIHSDDPDTESDTESDTVAVTESDADAETSDSSEAVDEEPVAVSDDSDSDDSDEDEDESDEFDSEQVDSHERDSEEVDSEQVSSAEETPEEINGAPVAVEPEPVPVLVPDDSAADDGAADDTVADDTVAETPVVAAVPVAATPGSVPAPAVDKLFADGDSFAERFREIQLRFVDSPKEATADAATLIGEAVDKVTAALSAQKDALAGDTDDTEKLRVQLRGYRDLLNRLSAL